MRISLFLCAVLLAFLCSQPGFAQTVTQGSLEIVGKDGKSLGACPLKHTDVKAEISGFLARVRVKQEFENNFAEKIEAVYVFPLPNKAAIDELTMTVGNRIVKGKIMRRGEARDVYEVAKNNGQVAALLDQERTNIFTQSVANILPNEKVTIEISYVETLKYDGGTYEFVFPTVVAPRYSPDQVTDANKIAPPIAPAPTRAGHDVSIEVNVDAGLPLEGVASSSHQIETAMLSANRALVKLKNEKEIPNRDFVLKYDVSGRKISDAVLTHRDERGGFFTLILQPPDNPPATDVTPKEIVFVLDTSGSMSGFPIEKAKEAMKLALDGLHPNDTFNLITFAGDTHVLFPEPVPATSGNLARAQKFLESRSGNGGTEMMKAIKAALEPTDSQQHVRIVCFMTDGHVGNDNEIITEVQKHQNARIFSFGIGSSVNRNLLDKIAEEGRGEAEYVSLESDGSAAAKRFHERVRSPLLTDVSIDWNGLPVADVYPQKIQDLFSAKPVVIHGRFTGAAKGVIRLKGKAAGREIVREIPVTLPENEPAHDTLATLWARSRVEDLTKQDYENKKPEVREAITNLGLEFRLLTRFTSFVAVEELVVTEGGQPRRVDVPIESPEGTKIQGNITAREIQALPKGASFSSLMSTSAVVDVSSDSSNSIDMTQSSVTETIDVARITGSGSGRGNGGGFSIKRNENSFVIDGQEASRLRTGILNAGNSSANSVTLNGKATNLPKPVLAPNINWDGSDGLVNVRIETHENGNVTSATAESGNPLLRAAAIQAAQSSKFRVTKLGDQPVQITGFIVYSFVLKNKKPKTSITFQNFAVKLTPEEQKRLELSAKVSPSVFLLIQRLGNAKAEPAPDEAKFVSKGKAEIRVYLADKTPEALEELKKAGFEIVIDPTTAKFVAGRIAIEKLVSLAEIKSVAFIAPQIKAN